MLGFRKFPPFNGGHDAPEAIGGTCGILVVETIAKVRRAYFQDRKLVKQSCRELRVSRNTVRKVVRSGATEFTQKTKRPAAALDRSMKR